MKHLILLLIAQVAWGACTETGGVCQVGSGKTYTTIQSCATAMANGQTCEVYAGTYNELVTVPAGGVGAYKTIQAHGTDVVTVLGFSLGSHTKLLGNCSSAPSAVDSCGFNIQRPSSPSGGQCVSAGGSTDVYIRNNVMYACGSANMVSATNASYVYIQGNTLSYACTTSALATTNKECNGIRTGGNHFLIENNDVSHVTYNDFTDTNYSIWRNNTIHDFMETEAGGNGHTDAFYASTNVATDHNIIEGNWKYHSVGGNAKTFLAQGHYATCPNTGSCPNGLIVRYNTISDQGGGSSSYYGWNHIESYNNTYVNAGLSGSSNGSIDGFQTASGYPVSSSSSINSIFYFSSATTKGSPASYPVFFDGGSAPTGRWGYNLAYCNVSGSGNCSFYGHSGAIDWLAGSEPGNLLGYVGRSPSNNPNLANIAGNDFHLGTGSAAIGAGTYLTTVAAGDAGSGTSLVVSDPWYFQDGYGLSNAYSTVSPDCISVGTASNHVCVTAVNYATNTLTLASSLNRSPGQGVYLYSKSDGEQVLTGSAPDMGAFPYGSGSPGIAPTGFTWTNGQALSGTQAQVACDGCAAGGTWSVTNGTLPFSNGNAALNTSTGAITGTVSGSSTSVTVQYSTGPVSQAIAITINAAPTVTSAGILPSGTQGQAYSQALVTSGGTGSLTCALAGGSGPLPSGLSFTGCTISGIPTVAGPYPGITVQATDANSVTGGTSSALSITIAAPDTSTPVLVRTSFCGGISVPGTCTLSAAAASGNRLVVIYNSYTSAGTSPTMTSVAAGADALSQLNGARAIDTASTSWNDIWSGVVTSSRPSVTITPSTNQTGNVMVYELQYASNVIGCGALSSQAATTTATGPSLTVPTKTAVLGYDHPNVVAVSSVAAPFIADAVSDEDMGYAHLITSAPGSYAPQWTQASATFAASTCGFSATAVAATANASITGGASIFGQLQ